MSDTPIKVSCSRRINGAWEVRINGKHITNFNGWFEFANRANAINLAAKIAGALSAHIEVEA